MMEALDRYFFVFESSVMEIENNEIREYPFSPGPPNPLGRGEGIGSGGFGDAVVAFEPPGNVITVSAPVVFPISTFMVPAFMG